jgi:hypothetical protein
MRFRFGCGFLPFLVGGVVLSATSAHAEPPPPNQSDGTPEPATLAPKPPSAPSPTTALPSTHPAPTTLAPPPPATSPTASASHAALPLDLKPQRVEPPPSKKIRFEADPVGDTGVLAVGLTFTVLSNQILSTGEIRPQQISPTFKRTELLKIDRGAISQKIDPNSNTRSNYPLYIATAYVVGDAVADIFRESGQAALVDAIMYAEAGAITQGVTNVAKVGFRRPRPIA